MKNHPDLILGTAMWGWTLKKEVCFQLLDHYYEKGFREVDTATNYPINKNPEDFRKAEQILQEWININGIEDLKVMMKVGSLNNMRSPEHNLTKSFLLMNLDDYLFKFGSNLFSFMIHWDNRNEEVEIRQSLESLKTIESKGFSVGFSGVKHPELYAKLNADLGMDFRIQIKHNLLFSDYKKYSLFHQKRRFITYGINSGGIKLDFSKYGENSSLKARGGEQLQSHPIAEKVSELIKVFNVEYPNNAVTTFNQIGMTYAYHHPDIQGILIGPSTIEQLKSTCSFYNNLQTGGYLGLYKNLKNLD